MKESLLSFLLTATVALTSATTLAATATDVSSLTDVIYISKAEGLAGEVVTLSVQMKNSVEYRGFQFDLSLPDGLSVMTDEEGFPVAKLSTARTTARKTDYFNAAFQKDGSLRVLCNSTTGYSFAGSEGEVATISLLVGDAVAAGTYQLRLSNIRQSDPSAVDHVFAADVYSDIVVTGGAGGSEQPDVPDAATDVSEYSDVIYVNPVAASAGEDVTLSVQMKNSMAFRGFQFDLYLPDGLSFAMDEDDFPLADLSTARTTVNKTDYFSAAIQKDGALRVLCNSTTGYSFSGSEGEVATIVVKVAETMPVGAYRLRLNNIRMSDPTAKDHVVKETVYSDFVVEEAEEPSYDEGYSLTIADCNVGASDEETAVSLLMENLEAGEVKTVAFDLYLPDGISLLNEDGEYVIDPGSRFASITIRNQFRYDVEEMTDGGLHVSLYFGRTTASYVFSGTSGDIASLPLIIAPAVAEGSYEIRLKNIWFNGDERSVAPSVATLTIGSQPLPGDADDDGDVDDDDVAAVRHYILTGIAPEHWNNDKANANEDDAIDVGDVLTIQKQINEK